MASPKNNHKPVEAVEVIRQAHQGYSVKPFIVRANDDNTYFVKGVERAGGSSLVSEAIAAELGREIGLPVPDWKTMIIPPGLIDFSTLQNIHDLRGGLAFASLQVENSADLLVSDIPSIPEELQLKVLIFDWWIRNGDRALGVGGGNVNLLLDGYGGLAVIDHNGAFDEHLTASELKEHHVFRGQLERLNDMVTRAEIGRTLEQALQKWRNIIALLPEDWLYQDKDHVDPTNPTLSQRLSTLQRVTDERFWGEL